MNKTNLGTPAMETAERQLLLNVFWNAYITIRNVKRGKQQLSTVNQSKQTVPIE